MESQMREMLNQADSVQTQPILNTNLTIATEKYYSVPELAKIWFLSESTVRRIFIEEPSAETSPQ
jgi:hypothetical protein